MSKFQKRHYEEIADIFRIFHDRNKTHYRPQARKEYLAEIITEFADAFKRNNPNFNWNRFITAIYGCPAEGGRTAPASGRKGE